jgi:hypothetical protein
MTSGVGKYYAALPEDAVILIPFDSERTRDYYADVFGHQSAVRQYPLHSDETAVIALNALTQNGSAHRVFDVVSAPRRRARHVPLHPDRIQPAARCRTYFTGLVQHY